MPIRHRGHTHETAAEARACEFQTPSHSFVTDGKPAALTIRGELANGDYTVEMEPEHRTLRVARQDDDASFMPGRQLISYLSGPDNQADYTGFAHITEDDEVRIWKRFRGNAALVEAITILAKADDETRDAMHSGRCARCNRKLTVPASKSMGYGPVCAGKVGA